MAVGFHRQIIMMMPALDIVAVFTGAMRYSNAQGVPGVPGYPLSAVGDRLKAAGHDRNRAQGDLQQMREFKALRREGRKRGS